MKSVMILGAGGREHALVKSLSSSASRIICIPGNGGISRDAGIMDIPLIPPYTELIDTISRENIDFVIVGPEKPLVEGVVDCLEERSIPVLGPNQTAAQIEGSKMFAKNFMKKYNIPTASFACFTELDKAREHLLHCSFPIVIKADGLAAGKGVVICSYISQAQMVLEDMLVKNIFSMSPPRVVIEEYLEGDELSVIALTDGDSVVLFPPSRDHKRAGDNDTGPNTGGMGAFSCDDLFPPALEKTILDDIIMPTVKGLREERTPYKGILYAGLILTHNGPYVIEYNCRFGDPETQALLPRISEDLLSLFIQAYEGSLTNRKVEITPQPSLCVILASGGYPAHYETGFPIHGLDTIDDPDITVYHSGTSLKDGTFYTSGGRVLGITAVKKSLQDCRSAVYDALKKVSFSAMHFRSDIGKEGEE